MGRFTDSWWRQFDTPTDGFVDPHGFVNRLPLRLESTEVIVHGLVDAKKMWADFPGEPYHPILVGGKYFETWYNSYVTPKDKPQVELPADGGPMAALLHEGSISYLQRVVCSDTPQNPGAALKAIGSGKGLWGFPKHPVPGSIDLRYQEEGGKRCRFTFDAEHRGKTVVSLGVRLPEADEGAMEIPLEVQTAPDANIGGPVSEGMQVRYGTAVKCTQFVKPWDASVDSITFGDDPHYGLKIASWDFVPVLKVHSPDFKICAFKPVNWISGADAAAAAQEHERRIAAGESKGVL
ncbi:unnamed protein product [Prorocentrum cordatum]|uniref:Acetoacetate decarboxylase n=1 Tax=Prorocentrum cordatum TaxID=2364126 RepID=A0ABN9RSQ6_9DINO|nr:unnamed protein product [Polarella glacialis]